MLWEVLGIVRVEITLVLVLKNFLVVFEEIFERYAILLFIPVQVVIYVCR
jgi:hypothetical protein